MKNFYKVNMKERTVYVELEATNNDEKEIKSYFKEEIQDIKQLQKEEFESIENKKIFELTPIKFNSFSIEDFQKKYPKNIGLNIEFNPELEIKSDEKLENRYLFASSDLTEIKILTVRNNGEYASHNINQDQAKKELEQHFFPQFIKEWGLKNETELKKVSEKIQEQEQKIEIIINDKLNPLYFENVKNQDKKIELEKDDSSFLNQFYKFKSDLSLNIGLINDAFLEKIKQAEKIETDIKDVKDKSEKVDEKIDDLSNSSLPQSEKNKLFAELEKDILNLKSAVDKLKEQNQNLKKELELLVEKNKIESHKFILEKNNSTLKDKIEALKNKTQTSKNEFQSSTENKITYKDKPESQLIKDYENLNDNQKER
ncbi:hypothetical protein [Arcobacter cloacae]|uniref:Uncharacterized protein n=1 Tax=Arcobacter cloacae TaxID=1054034 RepID=A0A6M8N8M7_9BACT|nr:hypothetical protein [Arcobacter cloacae]QKF90418.1 hypothetical protein ACLO_1937 [Arcobacter cloacae]RXI36970.1 hypothetical protein CP963_13940 [Arcobacter cloacae]